MGFTLWTGKPKPIYEFSYVWFEVLEQAKLHPGEFEGCVVGCSKDFDRKCREYGCLNEKRGGMVGWILNLEKFILLNEEVRKWLKENPNFDAGMGPWADFRSDYEAAIKTVDRLLEVLRRLVGKEKAIWLRDEGTAMPTCARQVSLSLPKGKPREGKPVPVGLFLLDYEYARSHLRDEKLSRISWGYQDSLISVPEAKKRGIVFAETAE